MFQQVYTILFVISFALLAILISQFRNKSSIYYVLLFTSVLVSNFGYMQMASAADVNAAIYANQTTYLGACFSPFFFLMCVADLSKLTIPRKMQWGFIAYSCVCFFLISTIGVFPWYYKSVSLENKYGISNLMKEYGPAHILFPLYLVIVLIVGISMIIYTMRKKMDVSYVTSALLMSALVLMIVVYATEKFMHLHIELLPVAYIISQIEILVLLNRISMYDIKAISRSVIEESTAFGFVILDSNGKFLGCDEVAKKWFPELETLHVDSVIHEGKTRFLDQVSDWVKGVDEFEEYFDQGDVVIAGKHSLVRDRKNRIVHCVYLRDDTKQQKYMQYVERYNENLARNVDEKTSKIRDIQDDIIISMASIVENRDNNTGGHIARTSDIVKIFVHHLEERGCCKNLTPEVAQCIVKAAPLHDFGKIAIPDVILNKPGKFTDEEYEQMKKHSAKGAVIVERILQNSEDTMFKQIAVNVAHYHHEKWDGKGYPEGISGEEIPFEARVMALADVFDALVSKRVYKDSFGYDRAFSIIEDSCGTHFDPELCKEFLACRPLLEHLYDSYED